jgi:small subunit ribosomal protein S13
MSKKLSKDLVLYGVRLPKNKFVFLGLTSLYGIGLSSSKKICAELGIAPTIKIGELTERQQYDLIRKVKENLLVENNLRDFVKGNIQLLIDNGSLRGFKHRNRLPVRGQRTHTNARTAKRVIFGMSKRS